MNYSWQAYCLQFTPFFTILEKKTDKQNGRISFLFRALLQPDTNHLTLQESLKEAHEKAGENLLRL